LTGWEWMGIIAYLTVGVVVLDRGDVTICVASIANLWKISFGMCSFTHVWLVFS